MTPLHIIIGIHYYAPPGVCSELNANADAVLKCTQDLVDAGLLVPRTPTPTNATQYAGTEGLNMWIAALTQVPLPHRTWTMPFRRQAYGTAKQWGAAIDDMQDYMQEQLDAV